MNVDMTYDGKRVTWQGHGEFRATSGLPGYQSPEQFCVGDNGPIPPGKYKIFLTDMGQAQDDGTGTCALKPAWGIQAIPRGQAAGECERYWANWGSNRARMEPADAATKNRCSPARGGFYIHDSTKGYSHGCIEVEPRLFPILTSYARANKSRQLIIEVAYAADLVSTNGGTANVR